MTSRQVRRAEARAISKGSEALDKIALGDAGRAPVRKHRQELIPQEIANHAGAHPGRYPKHPDVNKGQVYGGVCNVTRCDNLNAIYWNLGTFGLYCPGCARAINWQPLKPPLCVPLHEKPAVEDMEQLRIQHHYYDAI